MATGLERDRLREFIDLILRSLDEVDDIDGSTIASRACLSRYHFDRLVSSAIRESPGAFRRRLLLERAAWQLSSSGASITSVALESGYRSVEGFSRTFRRTFATTPGKYRTSPTSFRVDAANGIHFHPPSGVSISQARERSKRMDFVDRIIGHDLWFTGRLLDRAGDLPEEDLDRPISQGWSWKNVENNQATLRELLNEMVWNKEMWSAALAGRPAPEEGCKRIDGMKDRLKVAGKEFTDRIKAIRDRGDWDSGFVDALCDPPESFTYGGMLAHVATFSAFRRTMAVFAFRELGVDDLGLGDPMEWERSIA
jgi:AraC-like DNA-binding protein